MVIKLDTYIMILIFALMGNIRKNAVYNILLSVSQILFPLITFPYVSRVLLPKGVGDVSFVDSITQYFVLAAALGIPIYGVREMAKVKDNVVERSQIFSELLFIHFLTTCVGIIVYLAIFLNITKFESYHSLFIIGSGILFFQVFGIEWLFQGLEEFPYITKRTLVVRVLSVVATFIFVRTAQDATVWYSISLATVIINIILNISYARKFVSFNLRKLTLIRHFKPLTYIFSLGIVTSVYNILDTALLGFLSNIEQVGFYSTSFRLIKLLILVFVAFTTVMIPPLSKAFHEEDLSLAHRLLKKSFGFIVLLSVPASIGLIVIAPLLLKLYAGPAFQEASISLRILAPSVLFISLSNIFGMQILNPTNNEKFFFKASMVGMVVSVLINFSLIPFLGQVGAAISSTATELVVLCCLAAFALKRVNFNPEWQLLPKAILSSLIFIPICWCWQQLSFPLSIQLIGILLFSTVAYITLQYVVFNNHYLWALWSMVKEKIKRK